MKQGYPPLLQYATEFLSQGFPCEILHPKGEGGKNRLKRAKMDQFNFGNNEQLRQVQSDPVGMARQKGYQIPEELAGDPKAMVQHLIMTGQVSNPLLQRIMPMIQRMGR